MTRSEVTVVVNAHAEGLMLNATLRSVRQAADAARAAGIGVKAIVAADRPDPLTREFLANGAKDFEVLELDHGDLGLSRQSAAEAAATEWICFVDGDDLWAPNWIAAAVESATRFGRPAVWHPTCSLYFGEALFIYPHVDMESPEFELRYLAVDNYWTSAVFAPTEVVLKVPFLRSSSRDRLGHEDWNWHCRTIQAGLLHKVVPDTVHFIRRRAGSMSAHALQHQSMCLPHTLFAQLFEGSTVFDGEVA